MSKTRFHVGASGYAYKEWKGSFYPEDLAAKEMLRYYGERFGAVEINGTFYRMPTKAGVEAWTKEVPGDFLFAMKGPQKITHFQRLRGCEESVTELFEVAKVLKKRLGPVLFGLPPNFKKDLARLGEFLKLLPKKQRVAFEFRHASWMDEETFGLLREHGVALCVAEGEGVEPAWVATAKWGYVRLRLAKYSNQDLKKRIEMIQKMKCEEVFVFFKHEETGTAPKFAKRFLELAGE
ncbi:MAG TPA: DUF72 domain-containing protein [Tepidisphaeraceae bacterium]|jgi:uncharacterized protein YecE (DUF72 family)|nr:DUF72 domain-containing protein [Tepidisphaeraceae bacterium]